MTDKTMSYEEQASILSSGGHIPPACLADPDNGPGALAYAIYNAGGPLESHGVNFRGEPCPLWRDLPESVKAKWNHLAKYALRPDAAVVFDGTGAPEPPSIIPITLRSAPRPLSFLPVGRPGPDVATEATEYGIYDRQGTLLVRGLRAGEGS